MTTTIRSIEESERAEFKTAIGVGFGSDQVNDDAAMERFAAIFPLDGLIAAFDGDRMVGTFGSFDFEVTVPGGGSVPMAGTTIVTVHPTHRRRGVLSGMMAKHLTDMRGRGMVLAGLWASEPGIYGRFGYGSAVERDSLEFDCRLVGLPPGPGDVTVRLVDVETATTAFPPIFDTVRPTRAGMFARSPEWWRYRRFADPEDQREGATAHRHALAERNGTPVAYATYRQKHHWADGVAAGDLIVVETMAVDAGARRALWDYLMHVDLFPKIAVWNSPVDDPMLWEFDNPRYVKRDIDDSLWIRILDLPAALTRRRYQTDGRVVLEVDDPSFTDVSGRYLLEVKDGDATVERTDRDADVTLGIAELGAIYMGGRTLASLVAAGMGSGDADAVIAVDRLFRTNVAPFCQEVF